MRSSSIRVKFSKFVNTGKKDDAGGALVFGKGAKKESTSQIQTMLATENLVPNGFATVSENYKNLTGKTA